MIFSSSESSGQLETSETESESLDIKGLDTYTNYSITVSAFTRAGKGKASAQIFCQTAEDGKQIHTRRKTFLMPPTRHIKKHPFFLALIFSSSKCAVRHQGGDEQRQLRDRLLEGPDQPQRDHSEIHGLPEGGHERGRGKYNIFYTVHPIHIC